MTETGGNIYNGDELLTKPNRGFPIDKFVIQEPQVEMVEEDDEVAVDMQVDDLGH